MYHHIPAKHLMCLFAKSLILSKNTVTLNLDRNWNINKRTRQHEFLKIKLSFLKYFGCIRGKTMLSKPDVPLWDTKRLMGYD